MCIGTPMQVIEVGNFHAMCQEQDKSVQVDTSLINSPKVGDWLLVFLGTAREILEPDAAKAMLDATNAVKQIMQGNHQVEHLFEDLIDREPTVPPHLQHLIGD